MRQLIDAAPRLRIASHPLRLRIIDFLQHGEACVSEITEAAGCHQASCSQQLAILRDRGIVACRRQGQRVYYWLIQPQLVSLVECIRSHYERLEAGLIETPGPRPSTPE